MSRRTRLKLWIRQICDGRDMDYDHELRGRAESLRLTDVRQLTDDHLNCLFADMVAGATRSDSDG